MNLNREGCMKSTQKQLGTWEPSQRLLKDRGNPRKSFHAFMLVSALNGSGPRGKRSNNAAGSTYYF
jgi:hypothetical protein